MRIPLIALAALTGIAFAAAPSSVSAAPLSGIAKDLASQTPATESLLLRRVRDRHHRRRYHRDDAGTAAAAAIFGLAVGAIVAREAARHRQAVEWCMRRYRSYDPRTETWVSYDGRVHRCP